MRKRGNKTGKRVLSAVLTVMLAVTLFAGIPARDMAVVKAATLSNPRSSSDGVVIWDCVYFGSYPQAEVITTAMSADYTAIGSTYLQEGDLIVDDAIYTALQSASGWDSNGDIILNGTKYRRIQKADDTYTSSDNRYYYNWSDSTTYHYFQYQPVKWRVLSVNGNDALLLAGKGLDDQMYNTVYTSVTWENSTIRSWLNGYGSSSNLQSTDYSGNNFINSAFTAAERNAIKTTTVVNAENPYYGTGGGNDTEDRVFLLSYDEVTNPEYGFSSSYNTDDEARRLGSSTYAKAMGAWWGGNTYAGNSYWRLRSPGDYSNIAMLVHDYGAVCRNGYSVCDNRYAVCPALHLNLSSSNLWSYAGTVSSDGSSIGGENPPSGGDTDEDVEDSNLAEEEQAYITEHINFVNSATYTDRMNNKWAKIISTGLDTSTGKTGETMYKVIDSACDVVSFKKASVFDNPYDVLIADLILDQSSLQQKEFSLKIKSELNDNIQILQKLCSYYNEDFSAGSTEYLTSLEKLVASPKSVKESNPEFYSLCNEMFGGLFEEGKLDELLGAYGKANDLISAYNTYANVVEWVADCLKYNSLVAAYIDTSDEFKASLLAAEYFMGINASGDEFVSRAAYGVLYEEAYNKYANFMTNQEIADEMYDAYYNQQLFKEYFANGLERISDVFASAVQKNVVSYLADGLGLSEAAAGTVLAAVWAAKTGWAISEAVTGNEDNIQCRELARASYYLEDAMAWIVENSASELKKNQTYEAAKQFDAAYTILQNLECYALNNYITYLNAQQQSFMQSLLHGFNRNFNEAEIAMANIYKLQWQQADCHQILDNNANQNITVAKICCPVDVFVYDKESKLVFSVESNQVTKDSRTVTGSVVNEIKVLAIADAENYKIVIKATDNGEMDYLIDTYDVSSKKLLSSAVYTEVDIVKGESYIGVNDDNIQLYDNQDKELTPTNSASASEQKIVVSSVDVTSDELELKIGDKAGVNAKVLPENAYCPVVSWTSSDTNVATVSEYGQITAKNAGTAVIQCMAIDGSQQTDTVKVNVVKATKEESNEERKDSTDKESGQVSTEKNQIQNEKIVSLRISGISKKIAAGKKLKLMAEITPSDAANKTLKWTSSNKKYATVSSKGVVTTRKKGAGKTVTIKAVTRDGSNMTASYKIKLVKHAVKSIKLKAKSKTVKAGKKLTVRATVKTTGKTANKVLQWSSSNTKYAAVSKNGVVAAKKAGKGKTVKITAMATDGTGKKAVIKIKIK